jgi:hypothetical protein
MKQKVVHLMHTLVHAKDLQIQLTCQRHRSMINHMFNAYICNIIDRTFMAKKTKCYFFYARRR